MYPYVVKLDKSISLGVEIFSHNISNTYLRFIHKKYNINNSQKLAAKKDRD
jgi:hypothetical protein